MRKIFIPELMAGERTVPFLGLPQDEGNRLFQNIPSNLYAALYERVGDIAQADIVVLPHEYVVLKKHPEYLSVNLEAAHAAGKKILISAYQDSNEPIDMPDTTVVRPSGYKTKFLPNEIIMPAYVEDLGAVHGYAPLPKSDVPVVGFVGKANFFTLKERLWYMVKNYVLKHGPEREGIYFRRRALRALFASPRIQLNAIVRKRFGANRTTLEVSPEVARKEYVDAIQNAHFTLAPRGDGNYSLRFFETLSLGRIPVLIDTDTPLPLEDVINYDEFVVRVPWQDIDKLPDIVADWYASKTPDEWAAASTKARKAFETYLYMPAFIARLLQ
ncbi:MAG: Exostosin family protein [Candidatus Adlerbacteria bacterium]|nr:Exostosin family protein [Candidatus Adlerbacteria bacterium]